MLSAPTGRRLDRPENAGLKPYFAKLAAAKAAIDEKSATIGACPWIFSKLTSRHASRTPSAETKLCQ